MSVLNQHYRAGKFLLVCVLISTLSVIAEVKAHGLESEILPSEGKTVTVSFQYSDGSPASYTEVKVFSPENDTVEFQNGRTDKNGRFSFAPDVAGLWRIAQRDGLGHATTLEHDVDIAHGIVQMRNDVKSEQRSKQLFFGLLGCSLILNMGFMIQTLMRTSLNISRVC